MKISNKLNKNDLINNNVLIIINLRLYNVIINNSITLFDKVYYNINKFYYKIISLT